jgi:uncharacterized protein (DUF924 family)
MEDPEKKHRGLSPELREGLAKLFLWWYGNHFVIRKVLRDQETSINHRSEDMKVQDIEEAWRNRRFAKGDLQIPVDSFIREIVAWMLNDSEALHFQPTRLWEKLAMILLFDQITRNALRGTERAYANDRIALPIALDLMNYKLQTTNFHSNFKPQLLLFASVTLNHLKSSSAWLHFYLQRQTILSELPSLTLQESTTSASLSLDVSQRNLFLGREHTSREEAYLSQL